jgi:hypothetical protein
MREAGREGGGRTTSRVPVREYVFVCACVNVRVGTSSCTVILRDSLLRRNLHFLFLHRYFVVLLC